MQSRHFIIVKERTAGSLDELNAGLMQLSRDNAEQHSNVVEFAVLYWTGCSAKK